MNYYVDGIDSYDHEDDDGDNDNDDNVDDDLSTEKLFQIESNIINSYL